MLMVSWLDCEAAGRRIFDEKLFGVDNEFDGALVYQWAVMNGYSIIELKRIGVQLVGGNRLRDGQGRFLHRLRSDPNDPAMVHPDDVAQSAEAAPAAAETPGVHPMDNDQPVKRASAETLAKILELTRKWRKPDDQTKAHYAKKFGVSTWEMLRQEDAEQLRADLQAQYDKVAKKAAS